MVYGKILRAMPPKGWKSISVPEAVYKYFKEQWEKNKVHYQIKHGVTSFSGFVSRFLADAIEQDKKRNRK